MTDGGDETGSLADSTGGQATGSDGRSQHDEMSNTTSENPETAAGSAESAPLMAEPRPSTVRTPAAREPLDEETIEAYTTDRRSLDPDVQAQWAIRTVLGALIAGLILAALLGSVGIGLLGGSLLTASLLLVAIVWVVLQYRAWLYQIREDSVYLERGVVTNVRTIVPYVRIQHVDTSRGPVERALGLSTLVIYTAGTRGADVSIPGLRPDEARDLQQRLKELAIEAEGDDAL